MKEKILAIIAKKHKEQILFLALRNNPEDPAHGGDFYYVVTGGTDGEDPEVALLREIDEETGITNLIHIQKLPLIRVFRDKYGNDCTEQMFAVITDQEVEHLSVEHVEYKWLSGNEFGETIQWFGTKEELINILNKMERIFEEI